MKIAPHTSGITGTWLPPHIDTRILTWLRQLERVLGVLPPGATTTIEHTHHGKSFGTMVFSRGTERLATATLHKNPDEALSLAGLLKPSTMGCWVFITCDPDFTTPEETMPHVAAAMKAHCQDLANERGEAGDIYVLVRSGLFDCDLANAGFKSCGKTVNFFGLPHDFYCQTFQLTTKK